MPMRMFNLEDDMKQIFLEEAQTLLDESEAAFIAVDEGDHSSELIDKIFRLAHNFKSSAKTVGLQHLSDFGHNFEEVLTKIKNGSLIPDKSVCSVLLKTLDIFKAYVAGLKLDLLYVHDTTEITAVLLSLDNDKTTLEPKAAATVLPNHEEITEPAPAIAKNPKAKVTEEENLKVNRKKLDTLLNLVGELVVNQSMVAGYRNQGILNSEQSTQTLNAMEKIVYEIQDIAMALRMTPITPLFQKLKRIARDAGGALGKTIQFTTEGEHVEVDKIVLEKISDPLTHLVRNAVDHGIETDEERQRLGKNSSAVVTLSAQQHDDRIIIQLSDNGRGMNAAKLIAKAIEKGLIPENSVLTDEEAYGLIFKPGFSTKEQVTDMSGRGVGMDVVQKAIEELKGDIYIQTKLGEGTKFIISLPLSLSIVTGMIVGIDKRKYVVPISQLVETVELSHFKIESSTNQGQMFNLRGEVIPVYSLSTLLDPNSSFSPADPKHRPGLVTFHNGKKFSFEIDQIFGQQQIVLKKLGNELRHLPGIVAGAILNTGEPGLVLNLNDFIDRGANYAA
jgi:two-component system, chemotaxis family, sensor kinase CheA